MTDRKSTHVVMLTSTYNTAAGEVVAVTSDEAERLIADKHARPVRPGEVKEAKGDK